MSLSRPGAEIADATGNPVVETSAHINHEIAIVHRHIGFIHAVHAKHPKPVPAGCRIRPEAHESGSYWKISLADQISKQRARGQSRIDDAAAGVEDGPGRGFHPLGKKRDQVRITMRLGIIVAGGRFLGVKILPVRELDILWNVDKHGPRSSGGRDVKCLMDDSRELVSFFDQPIMLGARPGNADRVGFLECIVSDHERRNLAGDQYDRNGVHECIRKAGNCVGCAGT